MEVFTVITYIYTAILWVVVVKRMKHKLELRKQSFGVSPAKGFEGRVFSYMERRASEKRSEASGKSASVGVTEIKQ